MPIPMLIEEVLTTSSSLGWQSSSNYLLNQFKVMVGNDNYVAAEGFMQEISVAVQGQLLQLGSIEWSLSDCCDRFITNSNWLQQIITNNSCQQLIIHLCSLHTLFVYWWHWDLNQWSYVYYPNLSPLIHSQWLSLHTHWIIQSKNRFSF